MQAGPPVDLPAREPPFTKEFAPRMSIDIYVPAAQRFMRLLSPTAARAWEHGSFPSSIHLPDRTETDWNSCVTGLVIRALHQRGLGHLPLVTRALNFLEQCASIEISGAYRFWPPVMPLRGVPICRMMGTTLPSSHWNWQRLVD